MGFSALDMSTREKEGIFECKNLSLSVFWLKTQSSPYISYFSSCVLEHIKISASSCTGP